MRPLAFALALCAASPVLAAVPPPPAEEPVETPIPVPSPVPVGFLIAWKPMVLSLRVDSGSGSQFGSDKLQPLRALGRYTTTLFGERLMVRGEIEGGEFRSDTQGIRFGSDGYDVTVHLLGGTSTRITPGFNVTGSAGLISRYQRGTKDGGAPRIGLLGVTSNAEFEFRVAPAVDIAVFFEGGLTPIPYGAEPHLGLLSDASEFRFRLQLSFDISPKASVDIGYDYTRWHASFTQSTLLGNPAPDQALLIEAREHALTVGVRWKP